jgi:formylglycine-generating enzyme required for sulfatase activity
LLPQESAEILNNSAWYQREQREASLLKEELPAPEGRPEIITAGGLYFTGIPPGRFVLGQPFPREAGFEGAATDGGPWAFFISTDEVSGESWDLFLKTHPEWDRGNTRKLIEQGLVGSLYLGRSTPTEMGEAAGITGVSWYAAEAYCRWLTGLLSPEFPGWEARLPTEAEWEYAAKIAGNMKDSDGTAENNPDIPRGMPGGFWEWCAEPFAPQSFFSAPVPAIESIGSPERPVRGGSRFDANAPEVEAETRASLPPSSCSPFVSFRPILVPVR